MAIISAVLGGGGIVGLVFFYLRHFIDKRLEERDELSERRRSIRLRRRTVDDEWYHAAGRLLFYLYKAIETGHHNGELKDAFCAFTDAEAKKKALDREVLAESEIDM